MTAKNIRRVIAAVSLVVLLGCSMMHLAGCSSILGLPEDGPVQTMTPEEQSTRRVFTSPDGPADDAQPEAIIKGFFDVMPAGVQSDGFATGKQFLTDGAASRWNADNRTTVYADVPKFVRKASTVESGQGGQKTVVSVSLQIQGELDAHGVYTAVASGGAKTYDFSLSKVRGQWRISKLPTGVMISSYDFEQVYRQVSLYQLGSSEKELIPDVRWLCWRDWRTRAVQELLAGNAAWLEGAVSDTNTKRIVLQPDGVQMRDSVMEMSLSSAMERMTDAERGILVRQIRLSLGDGSAETEIKVMSGNHDYSHADDSSSLDAQTPLNPMYTLSVGNIVSLKSYSAIRVAQTDLSDVRSFVFSAQGGAVLGRDGYVKRLAEDGSTHALMFSGRMMKTICKGNDSEIWGIDTSGKHIMVDDAGTVLTLDVPGLVSAQTLHSMRLSPEGDRIAFSIESDGGAQSGVAIIGICRDHDGSVAGLSQAFALVSTQSNVSMMTFYNDVTFLYATQYERGRAQIGRRQMVPGPETSQALPDNGAVDMATGEVGTYRRLVVLDHLGVARTVDGSLDGAWTIADSQVTSLSVQ